MSELELKQAALPNPSELYNAGKADLGNIQELKVGAGSSIFYTDKEGSRWGHTTFDEAKAWIKVDGTAQFKTSAGDVLLSTGAIDGNFINVINTALNTSSKTILSDFTFETTDYAGAFKAGNPTWDEVTGLITGGSGVLINAKGILGANAGVATFTLDATTGNATFSGAITGSTITGGTITGGTLRTALPADGIGSAVVIEGGNNQIIKLYYNATNVGTISGLTTAVGAETEYLKIAASSGRFISLRGSEIAFDADLVMSGTHDIGQQAQPWHAVWAKSVVAYGSGAKFSINGADGDSGSFAVVTDIRSQTTQGRLEKKTRYLVFTEGIITAIGSQSSWTDCGPMNP